MSVRLIQATLIAVALLGAYRNAQWRPRPTFAIQRVAPGGAPLFQSEFLPRTPTNFVHAATLCELANGDLLAAWYGGYDEAYPDVAIYLSRQDHLTGRWSQPRPIEDRESAQRAMHFRVKSVGNPVLIADGNGVRMFYTSIIVGGWSGSTICMKSSPDGEHWGPATRLVTSPFVNVGMLVRGAPVPYSDGTVALPVYHELGNKWSAVARVDAAGNVLDTARIADGRPIIQPWIVPTSPRHALALFRWSAKSAGPITYATTDDAGAHWSAARETNLVHRDSAVAAAQLAGGSFIAIYNSSPGDRRALAIVRSADGVHWSAPYMLENDPRPAFDGPVRREYSYPFVIAARDGRVHVVYTWQRKAIRHLVFNTAWAASLR